MGPMLTMKTINGFNIVIIVGIVVQLVTAATTKTPKWLS
jgi:hypothetical protein